MLHETSISEGSLRINARQKTIFEKLEQLIKAGEPIPTVAQLGAEFGMSQQAMSKNLKVLEQEGLIRRIPGKRRGLELVDKPPRARRVPMLGRIAAGRPLEPVESDHTVEIPESLLPKGEVYALEVMGDSMIEDGILEGDVVIIRRQTVAFNGQAVVAVVNQEATLKRYYHEGQRIRLQPANATLDPIYAGPDDLFEIRGVVHALYRRFEDAGANV